MLLNEKELNESAIDLLALGVILKKLMTPVERTPAFKLGLIDKNYKKLKDPETREEKKAISILDKFVFKLKKILGPKVALFSTFLLLMDKDGSTGILDNPGELILEAAKTEKAISNLIKHQVLWNPAIDRGYIGSKKDISKYYHVELSGINKKLYLYLDFTEFLVRYGTSMVENLRMVDKDGNTYKLDEGV